MTPFTAEVVVVGGGVMGASTVYHLAKAGINNVVLVEREPFFGTGATGRCAGGIRYQFATEINIRLSQASLPMLDALEEETGQPALVRRCGYLFVLTRESDEAAFRRNVELQHRLGVNTQWLSGADVQRLIPLCHFPDARAATFNPLDGLADPNSVVMGYINAAKRLGARCLTDTSVTGIEVAGGHVTGVQSSAGRIATRAVVNCAGPWSAAIGALAGVDVPVQPLRRQWLTTTALPQLPPDFPFVIDFAQNLYFHREGEGVLTGMSNPREVAGTDQSVDLAWELTHMEAAAQRLPLLERAGIVARVAGLYENTLDAHPIIGPSPVDGFYLLAGFSGHGFMHGPVCGRLMAELLTTGQAHTVDIGQLGLSRFSEGRAIREYNVV